ncbi:MAG: ATP-binding protein [Candidatus Bathyarchaeia archaeon]
MVKFTDESFGAKLIEAITAGLYDGNLNCLREYVQNCIDSGANRIDVYFENQTVLVIEDNGCGMDKGKLEEALYLGISEKPPGAIGWRGIGIWSGIPACRRIVIITKKQNHPKLRVQIDADKLRQQYNLNISAARVLTDVTGDIEELETGGDESIENSQFTTIRLEDILPNQRSIFTEKAVREYLSTTVPAPFDTGKFTLGKEIAKKLSANDVKIQETPIFFEKQQIFRPPDNDNVFFNKIIEKKFIVKNETVAYGWVLSSKTNRKLDPPNRGICFKKKGFTIGDENLVSNLHPGNYNQWQYGEIHIILDALKENAPRNNFEANNEIIEPFYQQVGEFVGQLQLMNQYQSDNIVTRPIEQIKKQIEIGEVKPAHERIVHLKKKLQRKRSFPTEQALQGMKEVINKKSATNRTFLKTLEKTVQDKIKEQPTDIIKEKTDRFNEFIKTSHPDLKKHLEKTTKKGKTEFDIDAMNPVKELLQRKTGLTTLDSICDLSKKAYGWKEVQKGDNPKLLLSEEYRDRLFGVMIDALHELFVNTSKHEKGKPSFAFYELMTKEEKIDILTDFHMTQDLILRLIEKSKLKT